MNPCRCGHMADAARACARSPRCGQDYSTKILGPILERMDIRIEVPPVMARDLSLPAASEGTKEVATHVAKAREM
jgi:magnesium chelatase family protein